MTKNHTPTPWDTKPTAGNHQHIVWDQSGKTIALVYTDTTDAAFICRAVNAHDALVELLDKIHAELDTENPNIMPLFDEIGCLIARAKGDMEC